MSTGTLPLIPADIFFAKQKLTRELKREPTDEELANKVKITLKELNDRLNMKIMRTEYNENSLSPSYQNRAHDYYASSIQKNTQKKMPIFENPNRYDDIGGGKKRTRQYKNRKYTKKYKKSKSRRESMKKSIKKGMKKYI